MKILHLPVAFPPYVTGGREIYTLSLAKALQALGTENHICYHQNPNIIEPIGDYDFEALRVEVLPPIPDLLHRISAYSREYKSIPGFENYLDELQPDVVHFHDHLAGASLSHLKIVKKKGIQAVYTYHTPGQSCSRGNLRYKNTEICDGKLLVNRCTYCRLVDTGYGSSVARVLSQVPINFVSTDAQHPLWRGLSARNMTKIFIDSFHQQIQLFDKVHVHADWIQEMLLLNKVPKEKLFFGRTAGRTDALPPVFKHYTTDSILHFAFVGRSDFVKGIHILIAAVKLLPIDAPLKIHFLGPHWENEYGQQQWASVQDDTRFVAPTFIPNDQLLHTLNTLDGLIVPSIWLETGPLSVYDAFAAGVPVIGSNLGGIKELVNDGVNGCLFEAENPTAIATILTQLIENPDLINNWKLNISQYKHRTMQDLGKELLNLYQNL